MRDVFRDHCRFPLRHPNEIFDLGTATGKWAMDIADLYPDARVTGVDVIAMDSGWVPPNMRFVFYQTWSDIELELDNRYDLIHIGQFHA